MNENQAAMDIFLKILSFFYGFAGSNFIILFILTFLGLSHISKAKHPTAIKCLLRCKGVLWFIYLTPLIVIFLPLVMIVESIPWYGWADLRSNTLYYIKLAFKTPFYLVVFAKETTNE